MVNSRCYGRCYVKKLKKYSRHTDPNGGYDKIRFGHIRRWDQCAVYILYSKISTDPGLLKIRHSHRFVAVVIQFLIPLVVKNLYHCVLYLIEFHTHLEENLARSFKNVFEVFKDLLNLVFSKIFTVPSTVSSTLNFSPRFEGLK